MKQLLPLLLCYVLMTSQVLAISGGPVFGSGAINPVGTYSGIIQGSSQGLTGNTTSFTGNITTDLNAQSAQTPALGLFSLSVPTSSVATGAFLLFSDGATFTGNIAASIDIDSNRVYGIVSGAQYQQIVNVTTGATLNVETAYASGQLIGQVGASSKRASSSARINGTAFLNVTFIAATANTTNGQRQSTTLNCSVSGFRQSTVASAVSSLPSLNSNGN